jgi:hypothetical protein
MRSCRVLLVVCFTCLVATLSFSVAAAQSKVGRMRAYDSTVQVITETRFGTIRRTSGFLYSNSGFVATTFHAISDARRITVFHATHGVFNVQRIRRLDRRADIAILIMEDADQLKVTPALMGDSRLVREGDNIHVYHHPAYSDEAGYDTTLKEIGVPRQLGPGDFIDEYASEMSMFQFTGPFDSGSAGGIVCNDSSEVIGLIIGGERQTDGNNTAFAISTAYLNPFLTGSIDVPLKELDTPATSDADFFDTFLGPAPQRIGRDAPMPEGYIAWFSPTAHSVFSDPEFRTEINDKIDKNWFCSRGLVVDGRPVEEWSASRLLVLPATRNPWDLTDRPDRYIHFDADSRFSKRIYKNRDTEERIMTRFILAMPLSEGSHTLLYQNVGANYKNTGIKRMRIHIDTAEIKRLDIADLSLVTMSLLPKPVTGIGDGQPVRYELLRRPFQDKELNWSIRQARIRLKRD